jgi:hypothetical protein
VPTDRKIAANRENAKKSTGPRTAVGKAAVRGNAIRHSLLTKKLYFEGHEDEDEFKEMRAAIWKELDPQGAIEIILAEEIVVSWWKQQSAQRWTLDGLVRRRRASIQVLQACGDLSRLANNPFGEVDDATFLAGSGWDCGEIVVKVGPEKDGSKIFPKPDMQFEAKLGTSAENCLRYETAWKRDMYKALEKLHNLQQCRLAKSGTTKPRKKLPSSVK